MKVREWFVDNVRKNIIVLLLILVAVVIANFAIESAKTAKLVILVTPTDSIVEVDGKRFANGTYKMYPRNAKVAVSKDGFDTEEYNIELKANETATVYAVLSQGNSYAWYSSHEQDYEILKLIKEDKAADFIKNNEKKSEISSILPLSRVIMLDENTANKTGVSSHETYISNGTDNTLCMSNFCLRVSDNTGSNDTIKQLIKEAGYKYEDYMIVFNGNDDVEERFTCTNGSVVFDFRTDHSYLKKHSIGSSTVLNQGTYNYRNGILTMWNPKLGVSEIQFDMKNLKYDNLDLKCEEFKRA